MFFDNDTFPLLPLRGIVIFPNTTHTFDVVRPRSIEALKAVKGRNTLLVVATQKNINDEKPAPKDIYEVGCTARIRQMLRISDTTVKVMIEGLARVNLTQIQSEGAYDSATVTEIKDEFEGADDTYRTALIRRMSSKFNKYLQALPGVAPNIVAEINRYISVCMAADYVANNINAPYYDKQTILEESKDITRAKKVLRLLDKERAIAEIDKKIAEETHAALEEAQREYYLREQLKVISAELYGDEMADEIDEYYTKIDSLTAPDSVKENLKKHVSKLSKMPVGSHEATVERGYLDLCIELPWSAKTSISTDLKRAAKILERDIYGMKEVKERILELLAVYKLAPDIKGQIVCLVGPPGVGKTSIGRSLADCMGRRYIRISLGGLNDEAEIRGHRKTYVGAMPGKIIKAVKQTGSGNPLILLDEIDKLGNSYKGDPASAMLEVLDPEQNVAFVDNYVEMPFDLSSVVFVATANNLDTIPAPLRDRMDIIELKSYTREEKLQIAKSHLIPKQLKAHGLTKNSLRFSDEAIYNIADFYTREAGVRNMERKIATICRKAAKLIASEGKKRITVNEKTLTEMLGKRKYKPERILSKDEIGIINGLAWTSMGGEIMQLEIATMKGTGKVELTGSLGDVMKESAIAAVSYVRSNAAKYGIDPDFYKNTDIHIHATEAAVPKDGPSAGVTIATGLISALTGRAIARDVAMTGEITVRGRVLPIGGLKEKAMAAFAGGVKRVFIPEENLADLDEVDDIVRTNVSFIPVTHINEIISQCVTAESFLETSDNASKPKKKVLTTPSVSSAVQRGSI